MASYEELISKYGGTVEQQPSTVEQQPAIDLNEIAKKFGGQIEEQQPMGVGEMLGKAAVNLPSSTMRVLKETAQAVINPIDTAKNVLDLGAGLLQNALPESVVQFLGEDEKSRNLARQVGTFYVDRYGSVEGAKQAFAQDPAGVLADVSTVLGIGGATLPGKVGAVTSKAARAIDPVNLAIKSTGATSKLVGNIVAETLGKTTGVGGEPVKQAFKAGVEGGEQGRKFTENLRGTAEMTDVLENAKQALARMQSDKQRMYREGMASVNKDPSVLNFADIDNAMRSSNQRVSFKGQVKNEAAANKLAEVQKRIDDWKSLNPKEYHTPEGMDALKQSIGDILETIPFEQKNARAVVGNVYHTIKSTISKQAPTYDKVMSQYEQASDSIREIERSLSLGKKASVDTAMRKLQSLMRDNVNTNYGQRLKLAEQLQQQGKTDLMPSLAGQAMSSWTPRGIQGAIAAPVIGGSGFVGGLPAAAGVAAVSSPRLVGETAKLIGTLSRPVVKPARAIAEVMSDDDIRRLANLMYQTQQPKGLLE